MVLEHLPDVHPHQPAMQQTAYTNKVACWHIEFLGGVMSRCTVSSRVTFLKHLSPATWVPFDGEQGLKYAP
jgi:hypothetical protein